MCATTTTAPPAPHTHTHAMPGSAAADSLMARLDDPSTAAALHNLLDNAELLAMLVGMVDGLLQRSETITANLSASLSEVREASVGSTDALRATATDLGALLPLLPAVVPAMQAVLASSLPRPESIAALDTLSGALVEGLAETRPAHRRGVRGLLAALRDPETVSGLDAILGLARALGRRTGA